MYAGVQENLMAEVLVKSDVDQIAQNLSNWGRWGIDDERGALNFITTEIKLFTIIF